jgi:transcriptional regulator with XRE-family HTH domain
MTGHDLKNGRLKANWTQAKAASRFGLTQAYLSMVESGHRPVSSSLANLVSKVLDLSPVALPLEYQGGSVNENELQADLGELGYPGFAYLRGKPRRNPAQVLLSALDQSDLDSRLVEALPWLAYSYADMDWNWLVANAKVRDRQNRLGYVVTLAQKLGKRGADPARLEKLAASQSLLERSRLAGEDTLCHDSMTQTERKWLRSHRPQEARHWNLLTDLDVRNLAYASA